MFSTKLFILTALLATVNCRFILLEDEVNPTVDFLIEVPDDFRVQDDTNSVQSNSGLRVRRQLSGVLNTNPDGSLNANTRTRLFGNDRNSLNALAGINGLKSSGKFDSVSGGLGFENQKGHGLSVVGSHVPALGKQLTAAGTLGLVNNDNHKLGANAFVTRTMPKFPDVPNFNTYGGGLDYMYKNKVGGSLGVARTDFLKRTDYSAMGKVNLLRSPTTSLDLNGGFSKSVSPFISNSRWQPSAGLTFSKFF